MKTKGVTWFPKLADKSKICHFFCNTLLLSERALATLYVVMGPVFSVFWGFDTPETHIRHVQNLILIAEMETAS